MTRSSPLKYQPLADYLAALTTDEVTLMFDEIETILGASLPPSALGSTFWSNGRRGVLRVRPWIRVGWQVARTAMRTVPPTVTFQRVRPDATG